MPNKLIIIIIIINCSAVELRNYDEANECRAFRLPKEEGDQQNAWRPCFSFSLQATSAEWSTHIESFQWENCSRFENLRV